MSGIVEHKFKVGTCVDFLNAPRTRPAALGSYRVVEQRPSDGDEPTYLIKSDLERYGRVARESEMTEIA